MEHGGFANLQWIQDYNANRDKFKNMRESEIKRDLQRVMNVDFGSGDGNTIQDDEESGDEVNSNNLGDQLNDHEFA